VAESNPLVSSTDKGKRLFLACWPDQSLQETMFNLARRLQKKHGGRKTPQQNIHLTLLFLGQVQEQQEQDLRHRMRALDAKAFELEFDRTGCFARCKIKWIGTSMQPAALSHLYRGLQQICHECGLLTDDKAFRPHITLLRNSRGEIGHEVKPLCWTVDSYYLIQSVQTGAGVEYRIVEEFKLSDEKKE
jgi:2'-5' RNA ligase